VEGRRLGARDWELWLGGVAEVGLHVERMEGGWRYMYYIYTGDRRSLGDIGSVGESALDSVLNGCFFLPGY
jgi:hypothetical protein